MTSRAARYASLATERPNPRSRGIDLKSARDIVALINREDSRVAPAVARQGGRIAAAAEMIARGLSHGGRLLFIGAGTSGRLGILEAAECPPTFNTPPQQIQASMAGGRMCVFSSREGAEDDAASGERAVSGWSSPDVVVGIAASGVTPFVSAAIAAARKRGCKTVLVTCNSRSAAGVDILIAPRVGPEVISGSTRLKSGTAAKLVLNALTTTAMIRLGKVYDRWMVDARPSSRKLHLRIERMVCELAGVPPARARGLLRRSGGSAKIAVLMARKGIGPEEAKRRLAVARGHLRRALA